MTRSLHDLDFLTSVGLLVAAAVTILTGVVSDLWDLNEFWYHTLAGYLMTGLSLAHVWCNRGRLLGYAKFRWRSLRASRAGPGAQRNAAPVPAAPHAAPEGGWRGRALSRRGILGLAAGTLGGLVVGRGLRPLPPIEAGSDLGVVYHAWSKPGVLDALGTLADWGQPVSLYKRYPDAPVVALPPAAPEGATGTSTAAVIARRRSVRDFSQRAMTRQELGGLLGLTGGITAGLHGNARRAAPSSGALYPIELYALVHRVDGLEPGVYHYAYEPHALELVRAGDVRQAVVDQGLGQTFLAEAGVVVVLTQILQRMRPKYQDRSYRYGLLEAGHVGENAYLAATSMGLGACGVGAFLDDDLNALLGVDGVEEAAVYLLAIGHPAAA